MMKKVFAILNGALFTLFAAMPAFAADVTVNPCPSGTQGGQFVGLCNLKAGDIGSIISRIIVIILVIAVIIAVLFLIFGGIKWILSGGDKSKVESARNHIVAAIVGLVVALAAFFILSIVLHLFGIDITKGVVLPDLTVPGSTTTTCTPPQTLGSDNLCH